MTNLRSLSDLFRATMKLAAACAFATVMAAAASGQTPTNTFPDNGNAGIGTTTPTYPLTVNQTGNSINRLVSLANDSSGSSAQSTISFFEGATEKFKFGMNGSGATGYVGGANALQLWQFQNAPIVFGTNASERMRINGAGNIGIGTNSPQTRFDIKQSSDTFVGGLHLRRSSTNDTWALATGADNSLYMGYANNASGADAQSDFTVYPLVLTGSGNVGIGTATPDTWAKLHVYNAAGAGIDVQSAGAASWSRLRLVTATRTYGWFAGDSTQGDAPNKIGLYDYTASAFRMMFDSSGNVGVGTSNPGYKFDVQSGQINASGGLCIAGDCKTAWSQVGGGSSQWIGTSSIYYNGGNVGIGTTNPSQKLEVYNASGPTYFKATSGSAGTYLGTDGTNSYIQAVSPNQKIFLSKSDASVLFTADTGTGKVGIGTTTPGAKLDVGAGSAARGSYSDLLIGAGGNNAQLEFFGPTQSSAITHDEGLGGLVLYTNGPAFSPSMFIANGGNVGIGTTTPANKLHVAGSVTVDGNINAKYQDLAEWVPSAEQLSAGTVVVLDTTKSNQVVSSTASYDTRVAGVISAQPGITLGESGEGKVLVATTGRVRVKVDASRGPIQIGDLLVTSDVTGVAMKSEAVNLGGVQIHRPGTIIGKALEPQAKGSGEILVLLSLQ